MARKPFIIFAATLELNLFASQRVQREVQRHDIDPRFAEKAEVTTTSVCLYELAYVVFVQAADFGHARDLQFSIRHADVRVQTAAGCGHGVGRYGRIRGHAVIGTVSCYICCNIVHQVRRGWPQVAAAGTGRVIAVATCRRWTGMKIFLTGEILAEQFRAAHRAGLVQHEAAVGLVWKHHLPDAKNNERV